MSITTFIRFIALCGFALFISCGQPDYYFDKTQELDGATWTYANKLDYNIAITDTQQLYNIYLNLDHSTEYAYQNIYLMIHTKYPSGKVVSERLPINFADKTGRWYGKCNSEWCKLQVHLQEDAFFNAVGDYTISLEQYMRIDSLPGIKNIALMLEDTGKQRS